MTELEFELEFKKRKLQKRKQRRMELLIIGAHLGVVLVLLYWMFGIGMVHGRSMRPAYRDGDLFLYQRRLFREPDYGDVVVIHRQDLERDIVKRIAGKPGDVIDLDDLAPTEKTTGTEPLLKGIFAGLLEMGNGQRKRKSCSGNRTGMTGSPCPIPYRKDATSVWGITARGQKTAGSLEHSAGGRLPGRFSHSSGCHR